MLEIIERVKNKKKKMVDAQQHYYGHDLWSEVAKDVFPLVPDNFILYGEIVGFTSDGGEIQANYTYDCAPKTHKLYVYRIATINPKGIQVDLSWEAVKQFCRDNDLNHVPELWSGFHRDFVAEDWTDKRYRDSGYLQAVPLSDRKLPDEGVVVRVERMVTYALKAKSPEFLRAESKWLDQEIIDIESEESVNV